MDSNFFFAIFALMGSLFLFSLGMLALLKSKDRSIGVTFALFCFSVTTWLFFTFFVFSASTDHEAIFWDRNVYIGVVFIPLFMYQFGVYFLNIQKQKKQKFILWAGYLLSLFFLIVSRTDYFIADLYRYDWGVHTQARFCHHFFLIYFFIIIGIYFHNLYQGYRNAQGIQKIQLKYLFFAFLVLNSGGVAYLPAYGINFYPIFAYFAEIIGAIILFFVILKRQLLHLKVFLAEILIMVMGILLLTLPFFVETLFLKILTSLIFIVYCALGYYVAVSVDRESRRREDAETIASRERILRREAEVLAADLRRLDRAKTQFLLSTQHHLRSPLSVINGYLSMINEESYGKITKKSKEKVGACLEANKKLIRLVDELLDVAHFQMNNSAAEKEPVDAVALAAQIVADLAPAAEAKNLYLKFKKTEVPIPEIMLNPRGIKEALYNIVDNAIKYTQTGGVIVLISVFGEKLRIEIKDTGIGLNEKDREGIFGRVFERCERAKGANVEGKGIGLYLAAQIIANNGGKISVESGGWGKGSKFIIDLPMEDCDSGVKS